MTARQREIKGFALAPLPALILLMLWIGLQPAADPSFVDSFFVALFLIPIGYAATLLFGIPIHIILSRRGRSSAFAYLFATATMIAVAAIAIGILISLYPKPPTPNPFAFTMWSRDGLAAVLAFTLPALITAATFWAITVRPEAH